MDFNGSRSLSPLDLPGQSQDNNPIIKRPLHLHQPSPELTPLSPYLLPCAQGMDNYTESQDLQRIPETDVTHNSMVPAKAFSESLNEMNDTHNTLPYPTGFVIPSIEKFDHLEVNSLLPFEIQQKSRINSNESDITLGRYSKTTNNNGRGICFPCVRWVGNRWQRGPLYQPDYNYGMNICWRCVT